jgi:hypothetical protein
VDRLFTAALVLLSSFLLAFPVGLQGVQVDDPRGSLAVTVTDVEDGGPLAGVTVRLRGQDRGAITDASGRVELTNLRVRSYTVRVERLGFAPVDEDVEVREGERTELQVTLARSPIHLGGLVVTGTGGRGGPARCTDPPPRSPPPSSSGICPAASPPPSVGSRVRGSVQRARCGEPDDPGNEWGPGAHAGGRAPHR